MARYIDKEKALAHPFANGRYNKETANREFILGFESYKAWLETLPEEDVAQVKHAHWENEYYHSGFFHTCSCCHRETLDYGDKNFCPVCGAKMDGK